MKLYEVQSLLHAEVLCNSQHLDREVISACGSDLMSDVLAFIKDQSILLTGLNNPQVIRTAEMMDMKCVIFVRGKILDQSIIELARDTEIVVMKCKHTLFTACGILYSNGIKGEMVV